jgi:hypothetical protein
MSNLDMSSQIEKTPLNSRATSTILYGQLGLPRVIIGTMRGNISAVPILKECLNVARTIGIKDILLTLGPTSPVSLSCLTNQKILWTTFLQDTNIRDPSEQVVVAPTRLTDISVSFEKLAGTKKRARLLIGDFLDAVLSVSSDSTAFTFLSNLLTRIRERGQTAFFLLTEDMHELKKVRMAERFADVLIEYRHSKDESKYAIETRLLDLTGGYSSTWQKSEISNMDQSIETAWASFP